MAWPLLHGRLTPLLALACARVCLGRKAPTTGPVAYGVIAWRGLLFRIILMIHSGERSIEVTSWGTVSKDSQCAISSLPVPTCCSSHREMVSGPAQPQPSWMWAVLSAWLAECNWIDVPGFWKLAPIHLVLFWGKTRPCQESWLSLWCSSQPPLDVWHVSLSPSHHLTATVCETPKCEPSSRAQSTRIAMANNNYCVKSLRQGVVGYAAIYNQTFWFQMRIFSVLSYPFSILKVSESIFLARFLL